MTVLYQIVNSVSQSCPDITASYQGPLLCNFHPSEIPFVIHLLLVAIYANIPVSGELTACLKLTLNTAHKARNRHMASTWCCQMETFSALLALCEGKPLFSGGFPSQRPVSQSFDIFFDVRVNKQSRRWWFEMPWDSLWHHCNDLGFFWPVYCVTQKKLKKRLKNQN